MMNYFRLWVFTFFVLCIVWITSAQSSPIQTQILNRIDTAPNARESLVQRYYAIDDLHRRVTIVQPTNPWLSQLITLRTTLRDRIQSEKTALWPLQVWDMMSMYRPQAMTPDEPLSNLCKERYQLVDDRSFAFNLPTPLVLATLDMESSCRWYNPTNGDWVFQLIAKDYGTWSTITTGQWIMMAYDYRDLVQGKNIWYHNANKLSPTACDQKDMNLTGQTAPICLSYTQMDIDSIIKYGALYNGLAGPTIIGDIQPGAPAYVYGKLSRDANKDGLIVRILKILRWTNE